MTNFHPSNFSNFIGKTEIKNNLSIYINNAKTNHKSLDHCLIYGLPGTGKTTLATIIANELNAKIKIVQGSSIQKPIDIINIIMTLEKDSVLFIDEIHSINKQCVEILYSIMEYFVIDLTIGKDFNAKITRMNVPPFTLIGATTKMGILPLPLEERFGILINLKSYSNKEIELIIQQYIKVNNFKLSKNEIAVIANNSKLIPRNAIRILKRVIDFKTNNKDIKIEEIMNNLQICNNGLENDDIEYLKILSKSNEPIGIKTIADTIDVDITTIENRIEPYLLHNQWIIKTFKGRQITLKGKEILNNLKVI